MFSRLIVVVVSVGVVKIYAPVEAFRKNERQMETESITKIDGKTSVGPRWKQSLSPKLMEKLVCVPVISFCKIFISKLQVLMPYYVETGRF
jgi:hypothetical protein